MSMGLGEAITVLARREHHLEGDIGRRRACDGRADFQIRELNALRLALACMETVWRQELREGQIKITV
jgi:hypothetical protein